jgi:hypothetical protein
MVVSRRIPLEVQRFLNNLYQDRAAHLYAKDYRGLLIRETKRRYPGLVKGLSRVGLTRNGRERVIADADHIVPKSLWKIVMPLAWNLGGNVPDPNSLSNLFWRTVTNNRGSTKRGDAFDQDYINQFKREARQFPNKTPDAVHWANGVIEFFLHTKHDEGVNIDTPMQPHRIDEHREGFDVSEAVAFVQRLREKNPRMTPDQIAEAVEGAFPAIKIENDSRGPWIELG